MQIPNSTFQKDFSTQSSRFIDFFARHAARGTTVVDFVSCDSFLII